MPETDITPDMLPPEPEKAPSELLNNLLNLLIYRTDEVTAWLDAVNKEIPDRSRALQAIKNLISLGAKADVAEGNTRRLVAIIVADDNLALDAQSIDDRITAIYMDRRLAQEGERRC
ncbi:MAG: hypothetical protein INR62_00870 [Rhodospirillales bacterium]|nr:hypothetical protein [Acetobacter sp.]